MSTTEAPSCFGHGVWGFESSALTTRPFHHKQKQLSHLIYTGIPKILFKSKTNVIFLRQSVRL